MTETTLEIHRSRNKQFYTIIRSSNGRTLFTSETYKRRQGAIHVANIIAENSFDVRVLDKTKEGEVHDITT